MILRELIPRQVDKKSGVPRKEKMAFFFPSTFLSLSHIKPVADSFRYLAKLIQYVKFKNKIKLKKKKQNKNFFLFKPGTDDYTT